MAGRDEGFRRVLVTGANGKVGVRVVQAFQGVQGSADGGLPWQVVATGKSIDTIPVLYKYNFTENTLICMRTARARVFNRGVVNEQTRCVRMSLSWVHMV